jgi:hypothetical protein
MASHIGAPPVVPEVCIPRATDGGRAQSANPPHTRGHLVLSLPSSPASPSSSCGQCARTAMWSRWTAVTWRRVMTSMRLDRDAQYGRRKPANGFFGGRRRIAVAVAWPGANGGGRRINRHLGQQFAGGRLAESRVVPSGASASPSAASSMDSRDYPRSVMPDALCCWVFHLHRRWALRELRRG